MKRILQTMVLLFVFCSLVWAQGVPAQPVPIVIQPLINFDSLYVGISQYFTSILKEQWLLLISLFFLWFAVAYGIGMLESRVEYNRIRERVRREAILMEERERLAERRRGVERSRMAVDLEREYRSRELQNIVLNEGETFANIDGDYYVREVSHGVVSYKTLDQWRVDRDEEQSEPLDFDNEDYGRIYDSIVDRDYTGAVRDDYREIPVDSRDEVVEYLGLSGEILEPLDYEDEERLGLFDMTVESGRELMSRHGSFDGFRKARARERAEEEYNRRVERDLMIERARYDW